MTARHETRPLLAAAYASGAPIRANARMLTHVVEVDETRPAWDRERVLCSRVNHDSICDGGATTPAELAAPPTCRVCLRRDPRRKAPQ